jgi:hypothetical protein
MSRTRSFLSLVAVTTVFLGILVSRAEAAPAFQMPFPCNETWRVHTSPTHSPSTLAVDMNVGSGNDDLGRPVVASAAGTVDIREASMSSYGHYIIINHGSGWSTLYAHLQGYNVADGAQVSMGQQIGRVGNNNGNLSAHLHYEQRLNGVDQWVVWNGSKISYKNYPSYVNYTSKNCPAPPPPPPPAPSWSVGFSSLGNPASGGLTSGPDAASWAAGRLDVFARGTGNKLEHKWRTSGGWVSGWDTSLGAPLGLSLAGDPAAVSWASGRVDVFARANDGNLYRKYYNGSWSNWENLLAPIGGLTSDPDVSSRSSNRLDIFALGLNGVLYQKSWNGTSWSAWVNLGKPTAGALNSSPSAVSWDSNRIDVFARGAGNRLYHKWWTGSWSAWEDLCSAPHPNCYLASGPDVSSWAPGRLDVFAAGDTAAPHRLYHKWYSGGWSAWENLCVSPHATCGMIGDPGAVSWGSQRIDVFVRGTDNKLWVKSYGIQ